MTKKPTVADQLEELRVEIQLLKNAVDSIISEMNKHKRSEEAS